MSWIAALSGLLKLAGALAEWLGRRQLLQAGAAEAIATGLQGVLSHVEKARAARDRLAADPGESRRLRDKFTRPPE